MLETLLSPESSSALIDSSSPASFSSVLEQYVSLNPFMITGTALALYVGASSRRHLVDLLVPAGIVLVDNVFRKLTDHNYLFEQITDDFKVESLFVLGAYCLGSLAKLATKAYSHRRHSRRSQDLNNL